jgi:urea transport system permease protein
MLRAAKKFEIWTVALAAVVAILVLPGLNAFTPANSALHVSDFAINLYGKYLSYAILAISVDVLWGYTGLLSLGQALFFSLGGYMMGMHLMRMIGNLGQYHKPIPDFLVFLGWDYLPPFWKPFSSLPFALLMSLLLPGVLALVFGYLGFRSRIRGVYFAILTQALTYAACLLFFRNSLLMGGNNGFTDFKFLLGYDLRLPATQRGLYVATAVALLLIYLGCRWLSRTKFGLVQQAIRDGENRVLFSGYAAAHYKLFMFVLAALIAAIGGILYVPQVGGINPSEMATDKSLEAVVWVAVGGRGTLVGPIVGAIFVNALKSWATQAYPDLWLIILGTLFILVVLFLPGGIVSLPARLAPIWRKLGRPDPP